MANENLHLGHGLRGTGPWPPASPLAEVDPSEGDGTCSPRRFVPLRRPALATQQKTQNCAPINAHAPLRQHAPIKLVKGTQGGTNLELGAGLRGALERFH